MASGGMVIVKYLLFFFNFIFWLSGLGLIVVGAIIKSKYGDFMKVSDSNLTSAPVFMIVIGVIVAFVGFLGCCGAIKENYCMVTTFAVLLGIIFVLEIAAGALAYAFRSRVNGYVKTALKNGVEHYYNNTSKDRPYQKFMDKVQEDFHCCGYNDNPDHGYAPNKPPSSCENKEKNTTYSDNCVTGLEKDLKDHLVVVGGVGIGIAFVQLIGILFACCLMRSIKKEYEVM